MLRKKPSKKETSGPYAPKCLEEGEFSEVRTMVSRKGLRSLALRRWVSL